MPRPELDAVVVGAGPNGLAAAITLARAGRRVQLREAATAVGGAVRSAALTLPGFVHDVCSAVHPLGVASPFFRTLPLAEHGLEWVEPTVPLAHPLDDGSAVLLRRSPGETAAGLGADGPAWESLVRPFVAKRRDFEALLDDVLAPIALPRHPFLMARFGARALRSVTAVALDLFRDPPARALWAGLGAHSNGPLDRRPSAAYALLLAVAGHAVGWPFPRGGAQRLADALAAHFLELGGQIVTGAPVRDLDDLPPARAVLLDVSPGALARLAGDRLPQAYRRRLEGWRHGPGAFKLDWALAGPIPWRAPACALAGTVHLGGTLEEIAESERAADAGEHAPHPYVLLSQPTLFDPTRAPAGHHVAWAYCHLPNGSQVDVTARVESQLERFAPGFRALVLARHAMGPRALEAHDANLVGGDVAGGATTLRQTLFRPVAARVPYAVPADGLWLCSASTPPGGGVHGMCGWHAARAALEAGL